MEGIKETIEDAASQFQMKTMPQEIPHEGNRIYRGKTEAFLICDQSFQNTSPESEFVLWLRKEGFQYGSTKGNYGCCPWLYVNITRKLYAYGMPGIGLVQPIGNHAITIDDFRQIYAIFKKYEGKPLFVFHKERFDYNTEPLQIHDEEKNI